jgi:ABC-type dipeptide/oligopeptide/nickel transport system permease component
VLRLILTRLGAGVLVIVSVATFSFFMLRAAPGGPFDDERSIPESIRKNIEKRYHLDRSTFEQYTLYMKGLARLDLGYSLKRPQTVTEIIREHFPRSVILGVMSIGFATVFGVLLGVVAASRQNSWLDHASMSVSIFGISTPSFVLGPILIMIFSLQLGWLPPARFEGIRSMILPSLTLGLIYMGVIARLARSGLLETMRQDYIRTARAKGLDEHSVVWKHAVRLGLIPVVTYLGPATAALITGSFVVEQIFQIPGLGLYFVSSIGDRDYSVLTGVLIFYAVFLVLLNLAVDIAYGVIDPRIRDKR